MTRTLKQWRLFLALAYAAGAGCDESLSTVADQLELAMNKWEANGYPTYSMRFERTCFCRPGDLTATLHIDAGRVVSFEDATAFGDTLSDSLLVAWDITLASFKSVDGLFDVIDAAIKLDADDIAVSYHGVLGYPLLIDIDYNIEIIDEEIVYQTSNLVEES